MKRARTTAVVALLVLAALAGCSGAPGGGDDGATATTTTAGTTAPADTTEAATGTTGADTADSTGDGTEAATNAGTTTGSGDAASATFLVDGEARATVSLEIARTDAEHRRGLMGRESLAADHGMVFVFDRAADRVFWMKNTLIPLDMVFVAPNGTVLNVEHAHVQPNASDSELERYRSDGPAKYVIEVNRGFANQTGLGPGTEVRFDGLNATNSS